MTLARGKHANLSKMSPLERGKTLVKTSTEYIVFGDFVCLEPYVFATTVAGSMFNQSYLPDQSL